MVIYRLGLPYYKEFDNFQFVELKQNTVLYIAVMHYGVWLLIFLRKEQMQMKLVLAEKPSVAQSIAKVLGAAKREDGYLEGNGYVVSWCVGHLVELAQPEAYDAKYSKWAYADLPIFPMDWQYEVSAGTKKQFGILKKLMAREDVASLVCATDAGREGELIFRLVYHKAGCRKPFERLWISSMEDVAIKEGFENLRSGTEYDALKKMRTRDPELSANWGTICTPVQMPAADGKMRKIQAANTEGLLRIIQSIPSPRQNLLSVGWPKLAVNASKKRLTQNRQSTVL